MSEKRALRFGVRTPGGRRSRVWVVKCSAGRGDVYVSPEDMPSGLHFSLHDQLWQMTLDPADGRTTWIPLDTPSDEFAPGVTRAIVIAVSPDGLSPAYEPARPRVRWLPPAAGPGNWTHFNLFLAAPSVDPSWGVNGTDPVGQVVRGDGGFALVTHHEGPLDTATLQVPSEMQDERGEDIAAERLSAMLVLPNEDGSWRVVEGPVRPIGGDGFEVGCDEPWRPISEAIG